LNEVGVDADEPEDPVYAFYHATFQEYFAALAVEDWDYFVPRDHVDSPVEGKRYRIFEPQWKQVILLWLGREDFGDEKKERFIDKLVNFDDGCGEWNYERYRKVEKGFYEYYAYFLAAAGTSEFKNDFLTAKIAEEIVRWGFGDFKINKQERRKFIAQIEKKSKNILMEIKRNNAINALVELLGRTKDNDTCIEASESLIRLQPGNKVAIESLFGLLDHNQYTRREFVEILGMIAPKRNKMVIDALVEQLFETKDKQRYIQAGKSLDKSIVKDEKGINKKSIDREKADILRKILIQISEKPIDNEKAIDILIKILGKSKCEKTYEQIAQILREICISNETASHKLVEMLGNAQDESIHNLAKEILEKIAQKNRTSVIVPLVKLLDKTQEKRIKTDIEKLLAKITPEYDTEREFLLKIICGIRYQETLNKSKKSTTIIANTNEIDIPTLIEKLSRSSYSYIRREIAKSLEKNAMGNQEAINLLLTQFSSNNNREIISEVATILCKIAKKNQVAIDSLLEHLEKSRNEYIHRKIAFILGEIAPRNEKVILALVGLLGKTRERQTRWEIIQNIGKIGIENEEAISALVKLLPNTNDYVAQWEVIESIGKIGIKNKTAINGLLEFLNKTQNEDIIWRVAENLNRISPEEPAAINALVNLFEKTQNEETRKQVGEILIKIGTQNKKLIDDLMPLLSKSSQNEDIRSQVAEILGKIGIGNTTVISTLAELIDTTENEHTRWQMAMILGNIGQGYPRAIAGLLRLIKTTEDNFIYDDAPESLLKILTTRQQYAGVVSALKDNLSDEVYQNNFKRFKASYKLIWNCAANLPYPQFYQAWHQPPTTPHPEVEDNTPTGENATVDPLENALTHLSDELQDLPIYCLNAKILATETRESEIAKTLCRLIWKQALPNRRYPRPTTPADLCYELDELKLTLNQTELAILITHCETPTPELIEFCQKLTDTLHVAWLTEAPLEPPLKAFPPTNPI